MICILGDLPEKAKEVVRTGLTLAYGEENPVEVKECADFLELRRMSRLAIKSAEIILIVMTEDENKRSGNMAGPKYCIFSSISQLVSDLNTKYDIQIPIEVDEEESSPTLSSEGGLESNAGNGVATKVPQGVIDAYKRREESLMAQIKELEQKLEEGSAEVDSDVGELTEVVDEELSGKVQELESEVERLEGELSSITSERNQLLEKIEELEANASSSEEEESDGGSVGNEELEALQAELVSVQEAKEKVQKELENLQNSQESVYSNLKATSAELDEFKVKYSTQSSLLNAKEKEVTNLTAKIKELKATIEEQGMDVVQESALKEELDICKSELSTKKAELKALQVKYDTLKKKSEEVSSEELSEAKKRSEELEASKSSVEEELERTREELREYTDKASEEKKSLEEELGNVRKQLEEAESKEVGASEEVIARYEGKIKDLKEQLAKTKDSVSELDDTVIALNEEKVQMKNKLEVLEKSTNRDTEVETIMSELVSIREKYDNLSKSIYSRIADGADIDSKIPLRVVPEGTKKFSNIRVAFAGSTESRKGMYKCLLSECSQVSEQVETIIVDVVAETSVDYVFEIGKLKSAKKWFKVDCNASTIDKYLSSTCLKNTKVLSIGGTAGVNDAYFLNINWLKVLEILQSLDKQIIIVCGDISNLIGRSLHECLVDCCKSSDIYVHGNAVGARAVITNVRSLSNAKASRVNYFEYNKQVAKFVEVAGKTCETRIVSNL